MSLVWPPVCAASLSLSLSLCSVWSLACWIGRRTGLCSSTQLGGGFSSLQGVRPQQAEGVERLSRLDSWRTAYRGDSHLSSRPHLTQGGSHTSSE